MSLSAANTQKVAEAAEAICGALHRYDFTFLGESEEGASTWFTRGNRPRAVRVEVVRSALAPMVLTNIEWRTEAGMRGRQTAQVDVRGATTDVFEATESAVLRCLEVFRDVLEGKGVAAARAHEMPAKATPVVTADTNVPETDDETREAEQ